MANSGGIWTGLLKWSLAQPNFGSNPNDVKPMSDEDKAFLRNVFDNLIVDEVKRMKIIVEILKMPDDEPGIQRLIHESTSALAKLHEVGLPLGEAGHYGAPKPAAANNLAAPTPAAASKSPSKSSSPAPGPTPTPSPSSAAAAAAAAIGPVPTITDYQKVSIPELRVEMLQRKEGALEELDDRVVTSDNANDFIKVGGLEPLLISMLSSADGVRWRAAQALSTITQNNPSAQRLAFEHQAIQYLVPLLTPPPPPASASSSSSSSSAAQSEAAEQAYADKWTVVVKALTALSALIRSDDQPMIRDAFMKADGFGKLCALLQLPYGTTRMQTKVFAMLKLVFTWYPHTKALAVKSGLLPAVIRHVGRSADINHREACIRLLVEFARKAGTKQDEEAAKELRHKSYGLKEVLAARVKALKAIGAQSKDDKDMVEDELQQTNALIKACKF